MNNSLESKKIQLVRKALNAFLKYCSSWSMQIVIQPSHWLNPTVMQYRVLLQGSDALMLLKERYTYMRYGHQTLQRHKKWRRHRDKLENGCQWYDSIFVLLDVGEP